MALSRCSQTPINCKDCDSTDNVSSSCIQCNGYICSECEHTHMEKFGSHTVIPKHIFRRLNKFEHEKCKLHITNDITVYCEDCNTPCCGHCLSNEHLNHKLASLNEKVGVTLELLEKYTYNLSTRVLPSYLRMKDQLGTEVKKSSNEIKLSKEKIVRKCKELREQLNIVEENLLDVADLFESKFNDEVKRLDQQFDTEVNKVKNLIEKCERNSESPSSSTIGVYLAECIDIIHLQPSTIILPTYPKLISDEKDIKTEIQGLVGELREGSPVQILPGDKELIVVGSFEIDHVPFKIIPISSNKTWISGSQNTPALFNSRGRRLDEVPIAEKHFVVTTSGDIIYSHKQEVRIVSHGKSRRLLSTVPYSAKGMCTCENQDIVVCMVDENRRKSFRERTQEPNGRVCIFSKDGKTKKLEISHWRNVPSEKDGKAKLQKTVKNASEDTLFNIPERVIQNLNGDYVVVDKGLNMVIAVDKNGTPRWHYNGLKHAQEKFNPQDLVCDRHSRIVVTDTDNHRLHLIDVDGQVTIIIDSRDFNIPSPSAIGIDLESNILWLGSNALKNYVYQLQYLNS